MSSLESLTQGTDSIFAFFKGHPKVTKVLKNLLAGAQIGLYDKHQLESVEMLACFLKLEYALGYIHIPALTAHRQMGAAQDRFSLCASRNPRPLFPPAARAAGNGGGGNLLFSTTSAHSNARFRCARWFKSWPKCMLKLKVRVIIGSTISS